MSSAVVLCDMEGKRLFFMSYGGCNSLPSGGFRLHSTHTHTQVYKYNRATREKSGWCRVTSSRMKSRSDTPPCIFSETYLSLKLFLARF